MLFGSQILKLFLFPPLSFAFKFPLSAKLFPHAVRLLQFNPCLLPSLPLKYNQYSPLFFSTVIFCVSFIFFVFFSIFFFSFSFFFSFLVLFLFFLFYIFLISCKNQL